MRIKRTTLRSGIRRTPRTVAASGLLAAAVLFAPGAAGAESTTYSAEQLAAASDAVLTADVAGTAWYTDDRTGKVVVTADSTVSDKKIAEIRKAAGPHAGAIRIERTPGKITPLIAGGDAIHASAGWRCSLGFNTRNSSGTYYFMTAGHCTDGYPSWYTDSGRTTALGPTASSSYPGNDFGIVRHTTSIAKPGTVNLHNGSHRDITRAAAPYVGQHVQRSGSTTGLREGDVEALNASVNYGGGEVVRGLVQTSACAEPGDSGGPFFSGSTALGLTSGGSGDCSSGGVTFFQPVLEALDFYRVSVY